MSILQYPDAVSASELQVWNNAAFDDGDSEDLTPTKASWSNLKASYVNRSLESDCRKENQSPVLVKSPVPLKSSIPVKPLNSNNVIGNSQGKPPKVSLKQGFLEPLSELNTGIEEEEKNRDEQKIDMEIEEIQKEINRLLSKLEALRLEKAESKLKTIERRGRIVPAKFMEQKQGVKKDSAKKIDDSLVSGTRANLNRRGVSLGPAEIVAGARSRLQGKHEITPVQPIQSRRKSCFWKLQEIDETKVTKERGKSSSLSPKSGKTVSKIQTQRQAATTVGSKKTVKKEDGILATIQPKKLFREVDKTASTKKPLKPGRVVASRYSQISNQLNGSVTVSDVRKRSLPENDKEDVQRCDKRRVSRGNAVMQKTDTRVKKRWEIPNELVVYKSVAEDEEPPQSFSAMRQEQLPRIRIARRVNESPRDSGAAKKVVELVGRRSYFAPEEEVAGAFVCQALTFKEEDPDEEEAHLIL
ncbi:hypothetical protein HS088_TW06G00167 [Tripterygium wilfordii]|uniref:Uncharacterized protein n=1 Tax=Tripterygium wilfordii TaxID=458696 RepID=A0A7J7DI19_TRIWF|nr:uncharacterized protein LOC120000933 [Tripterygium wilfordii]KAF5746002.1 hypothetical protein HS088_TW06G00167 [Tripterygium wilfordii]